MVENGGVELGTLTVRKGPHDVAVIALLGEHDAATSPDVRAAIEAEAAAGRGVVLSLAETTFIDSSVVATIISGDRHMLARGRRLVLHLGRTPTVDRVLEIGGVLHSSIYGVTIEEACLYAAQSDREDDLLAWSSTEPQIAAPATA